MRLICSCCGTWFNGSVNSDHDTGFGLCPVCTEEQRMDNQKEMDKSIKLLADNLSGERSKKFLSMGRGMQEHLVHEAIKDGIIKFEVRR